VSRAAEVFQVPVVADDEQCDVDRQGRSERGQERVEAPQEGHGAGGVLAVTGPVCAPHVEEREGVTTRQQRQPAGLLAHAEHGRARGGTASEREPGRVEVGGDGAALAPVAGSLQRETGGEGGHHRDRRARAPQRSGLAPAAARDRERRHIAVGVGVGQQRSASVDAVGEEAPAGQQRAQRRTGPGAEVASHRLRRVVPREQRRLPGRGLRQPGHAEPGVEGAVTRPSCRAQRHAAAVQSLPASSRSPGQSSASGLRRGSSEPRPTPSRNTNSNRPMGG
jgi:hypothetical protein